MRKSVLIILCCFLLTLTGCLGSSSSGHTGRTAQDVETQRREAMAADALDKAMQLYHDGEYLEEQAALGYLNEAVELQPTLLTARYQRAILLLELGRDADALADTTALLEIDPDHIRGRFTHAFIKYRRQDYTAAVRDFSLVLKQDDSISEAFAMRGASYAKMNRNEDAIHDFTKAIALNPAHPEAYYNRGIAHIALDEDAKAVRDLTQAMTLDSQSLDTIMARASSYMRLGKFKRAAADFHRAIVLSPSDSALFALLAEAQAGLGDYKKAEESGEKALALADAEGDDKAATAYSELIKGYKIKAAQPKPAKPAVKTETPKDKPEAPSTESSPEEKTDLPTPEPKQQPAT